MPEAGEKKPVNEADDRSTAHSAGGERTRLTNLLDRYREYELAAIHMRNDAKAEYTRCNAIVEAWKEAAEIARLILDEQLVSGAAEVGTEAADASRT